MGKRKHRRGRQSLVRQQHGTDLMEVDYGGLAPVTETERGVPARVSSNDVTGRP